MKEARSARSELSVAIQGQDWTGLTLPILPRSAMWGFSEASAHDEI
jgi:hypothetical protein